MRVLNCRANGDWIVTLPPSPSGAAALCVVQRLTSQRLAPADADHKPLGIVGRGDQPSTQGYSSEDAKTLGLWKLREFAWNQ